MIPPFALAHILLLITNCGEVISIKSNKGSCMDSLVKEFELIEGDNCTCFFGLPQDNAKAIWKPENRSGRISITYDINDARALCQEYGQAGLLRVRWKEVKPAALMMQMYDRLNKTIIYFPLDCSNQKNITRDKFDVDCGNRANPEIEIKSLFVKYMGEKRDTAMYQKNYDPIYAGIVNLTGVICQVGEHPCKSETTDDGEGETTDEGEKWETDERGTDTGPTGGPTKAGDRPMAMPVAVLMAAIAISG